MRADFDHTQISYQVYEQIREDFHETDLLGEQLIGRYLREKKTTSQIQDYHWTADENAISAYDFEVTENNQTQTLIDVKSTRGDFENRLHISYNELLQMRETEQYHLYRVYEITDNSYRLRIARNLTSFAESIVSVCQGLPAGIQADSISVRPADLDFEAKIVVTIPDFVA